MIKSDKGTNWTIKFDGNILRAQHLSVFEVTEIIFECYLECYYIKNKLYNE